MRPVNIISLRLSQTGELHKHNFHERGREEIVKEPEPTPPNCAPPRAFWSKTFHPPVIFELELCVFGAKYPLFLCGPSPACVAGIGWPGLSILSLRDQRHGAHYRGSIWPTKRGHQMLLPGPAKLPHDGAGWRRGPRGLPGHEWTGQHPEGIGSYSYFTRPTWPSEFQEQKLSGTNWDARMNSEKEVNLVPDVLSSVLNYLDLITAQYIINACCT